MSSHPKWINAEKLAGRLATDLLHFLGFFFIQEAGRLAFPSVGDQIWTMSPEFGLLLIVSLRRLQIRDAQELDKAALEQFRHVFGLATATGLRGGFLSAR